MKTSMEWLDAAKLKAGIKSDYALAKRLGESPNRISNYRTGTSRIGDDVAVKLAAMLEIDPLAILASTHAERATQPAMRSVWERIAQKVAAALLIGAGITGAGTPAPANAAFNSTQMGAGQNTHIRIRRRARSSIAASALEVMAALSGIPPERR